MPPEPSLADRPGWWAGALGALASTLLSTWVWVLNRTVFGKLDTLEERVNELEESHVTRDEHSRSVKQATEQARRIHAKLDTMQDQFHREIGETRKEVNDHINLVVNILRNGRRDTE